MYDLCWAPSTPNVAAILDRPLIRRLALSKIWVDARGVRAGNTFWKPGHEGPCFDPQRWLRDRSTGDFDVEDIGALSTPAPTAAELSEAVTARYAFLADLDPDEQTVARANEADRSLVLRLLAGLPGARVDGIGLY